MLGIIFLSKETNWTTVGASLASVSIQCIVMGKTIVPVVLLFQPQYQGLCCDLCIGVIGFRDLMVCVGVGEGREGEGEPDVS